MGRTPQEIVGRAIVDVLGHEALIARDGSETFRSAASFRPELILLDLGMPELNGYEVCRRIRQESWGAAVVIAALTGWGQEDDRRRSLEAGFDAHLVNPVLESELEALLTDLRRGVRPARA